MSTKVLWSGVVGNNRNDLMAAIEQENANFGSTSPPWCRIILKDGSVMYGQHIRGARLEPSSLFFKKSTDPREDDGFEVFFSEIEVVEVQILVPNYHTSVEQRLANLWLSILTWAEGANESEYPWVSTHIENLSRLAMETPDPGMNHIVDVYPDDPINVDGVFIASKTVSDHAVRYDIRLVELDVLTYGVSMPGMKLAQFQSPVGDYLNDLLGISPVFPY